MDRGSNVDRLRRDIRDAIQRKFAELVKDVKSGAGSLTDVAAQIGVTRPALTQYAGGSVPQSDVLLAAFLKWGWMIRVEGLVGSPTWCEFSASDMEGGIKKRKREPIQLSLFDALTDLDQDLETLKKSVSRAEVEILKALAKPS